MANNKDTKGKNENVNFTFADPAGDSSLVIAELLEEEKKAEKEKAEKEKAAIRLEAVTEAEGTETDPVSEDEDKEEKKESSNKETEDKEEVKRTEKEEKEEKKASDKKEKKTAAKKEKKASDKKEKKTAAKKEKKTAEKKEKKTAPEKEKKTAAKKTAVSKKSKAAAAASFEADIKAEKASETKGKEEGISPETEIKPENKTAEKKEKKTAAEKEKKIAAEKEKKTAAKKTAASKKSKAAAAASSEADIKAEKTEEKKEEAAAVSAPAHEAKRSGRVKRHLEQAGKLSGEKKESKKRTVIILTAAAVILIFIIAAVWGVYRSMYETRYVASGSKDAVLYAESEEPGGELTEAERIVRGSAIRVYRDTLETDQGVFRRVEAEEAPETDGEAETGETPETDSKAETEETPGTEDGAEEKTLYINEENIAETADDVVRETEVYVRTPATIYAEAEGPAIASFAPKGSCLEVRGYDSLQKDGSIHKYKVAYTDPDGEAGEGYVYGKYMTDSQEAADAVYNENGVYDKARKDVYGFNLHGGKAKNLDYYPYEKPVIEGNEFCADARTMYLNCAAVVHPKNYVKIINDTDCNAVVCDIKDGVLAYESEVAKEMSPRSYKTAYVSEEEYKAGVDALRETGAYLIGRIVVFNDPIYAKDHPENCIKEGGSTNWPSAYSRGVWEYNVRLAQEAVEKFGFNEIQFDYVRFPESSYEMSKSGGVKWRNKYDEEKGQAVQNFCFYAADQIHEAGAYFSIDVFGESVYGYMTAYGQYWPGLTNIVDAISAMPYTDHTGGEGAWTDPGGTVKRWAKRAKKMQDYVENPAAARTWITGYDTPYWAPTENYGPKQLKAQAKALKKQGLTGGFIPWNSGSSLAKYRQYKDVWNTD